MPAVEYERVTPETVPSDARSFEVPMRDRVRLATDVYIDGDDLAPGPTVLIRLPYDKTGAYCFIPDVARYFRAHGYRVVAQDVRGKFRSEGETLTWINEVFDGYDTIDWIVQQPWSDGIVGMWGDSYFGYTQLAAASSAHPALRAIVPRLTGTRLGALPERRGCVSEVEMGVNRFYDVMHFQGRDSYEWLPDFSARPLVSTIEAWFATIGFRSAAFDVNFPYPAPVRRFPAGHPFDAPAIPMLQTIGWWDNCAPWQWADRELIARRPAWQHNEYLLLLDIDHENNRFTGAAHPDDDDPVIDGDARAAWMPRTLDAAVEFFDVFLRGLGGAGDIPRVRWRVAGEDTERAADSWPPAESRRMALYATADELTDEPGVEEWRSWVHQPNDLVPSPAENAFAFLREYPDERELADRDDVLAFMGAGLSEPLLLAGPVLIAATVVSDGPEIDVFARLTDVDVAGDGSAHLIARGQVTLYDPSQPTLVTIDMGQVGYRLAAGHALRLTIASSDFPEFVPAPGNGGHRWLAVDTQPNQQRLLLGGDGGLRLTVSVLR